ncbi:MAG: hypothetical protein Q8Q63_07565 [Phaeovulum sp.]|uniref:hypothetical protein n=1 Tax=Phaeovulum sp. TaxID=2934796 RepID=UPI00272F9607|nr:hypothetical protein [Phaeovulum sp.]MDP2061913.1 hypothetical protein [Phaeovulum sp.]MDP3861428.1 hypothetical protein [Phaeovulum sp.]
MSAPTKTASNSEQQVKTVKSCCASAAEGPKKDAAMAHMASGMMTEFAVTPRPDAKRGALTWAPRYPDASTLAAPC